ncbi:hypothetical protein AAZV13_20G057100 [Glycine max]
MLQPSLGRSFYRRKLKRLTVFCVSTFDNCSNFDFCCFFVVYYVHSMLLELPKISFCVKKLYMHKGRQVTFLHSYVFLNSFFLRNIVLDNSEADVSTKDTPTSK